MTELEQLLKDYLDYLEVEKNRSQKTRENYERYLRAFLADTKAERPVDITEALVRNFRLSLARKDLKKITQNYYIIALRNFLRYLVKRDIEALAPEKVELPKVSREQIEVLDYRDLERLLAPPTETTLRALRDHAVLETLFSTGLRLSELCALDRYLDINRGEFTVRGKGGKLRVVFLSDRAKRALTAYLEKRTDTEPALFVSLTKEKKEEGRGKSSKVLGRITPRAVERLVEMRARQAGIAKRVHPHEIRHSFATDLLLNGADIRAVQELLGHVNVSTTQVYTHLTNRELREVHRAFHGRRRG